MEKWMRGLSKPTALILGVVVAVALIIFCAAFYNMFSGLIPMIILGAILGGGVGLSLPLIFKGITGKTPQERKELQQNNQ